MTVKPLAPILITNSQYQVIYILCLELPKSFDNTLWWHHFSFDPQETHSCCWLIFDSWSRNLCFSHKFLILPTKVNDKEICGYNPDDTDLTSLWCWVRMLVEKVFWGPLRSITGFAWLILKRGLINSYLNLQLILLKIKKRWKQRWEFKIQWMNAKISQM